MKEVFEITLNRAKRLMLKPKKYEGYVRRWNKLEADLLKKDLIKFINDINDKTPPLEEATQNTSLAKSKIIH